MGGVPITVPNIYIWLEGDTPITQFNQMMDEAGKDSTQCALAHSINDTITL